MILYIYKIICLILYGGGILDRELLRGVLDIILLSFLKKSHMYGYELSKNIKSISNNNLSIGEGTLYPALKRLEENKFIESYWITNESSVKRKYYKITTNGIEYLSNKIKDFKIINLVLNLCIGENINE